MQMRDYVIKTVQIWTKCPVEEKNKHILICYGDVKTK